jgi:hypothetical protein
MKPTLALLTPNPRSRESLRRITRKRSALIARR